MTCRHGVDRINNPGCSSYKTPEQQYDMFEKQRQEIAVKFSLTPDASKYEIEDAQQVGNHLVMKVRYPNCAKCSYEGSKVMVFLDVKTVDALKWKEIDPHFRNPQDNRATGTKAAPSPAARFPASEDGWSDAVEYARFRMGP